MVEPDIASSVSTTGWPGESLQALIETEAKSLQDFRSETRPVSESELAQNWREFHGSYARLLDTPTHYLSLLRGTLIWLNILGGAASPEKALDDLNGFGGANGAMPLAMTYDQQPDNQVMAVFRSCFDESGVPLRQSSADGELVYAIFFGMQSLRKMYEWQFGGQNLTPAVVSELWDYSIAAHALNAPLPIASLINPRTDLRALIDVAVKGDEKAASGAANDEVQGAAPADAGGEEGPPAYAAASQQAPAGWYPDPGGISTHRYWDGASWTEHRA